MLIVGQLARNKKYVTIGVFDGLLRAANGQGCAFGYPTIDLGGSRTTGHGVRVADEHQGEVSVGFPEARAGP